MRRYADEDEERIRAQTQVRDWTASGLLDPSQGARLEGELRVDVRRTNVFLRAALALFTILIVAASVLFIVEGLSLHGGAAIAAVSAVAALGCIGLAEALIARLRFYRFGVEEALAVVSVVLLGFSGSTLTEMFNVGPDAPSAVGLLIGAAGGLGLYRRFGFVYAAIGAMACAAAIPFQMDLSATARHLAAATMLAAIIFVARSRRMPYQDEYPGDEYGQLHAAAWAGLYITMNLKIPLYLLLMDGRMEGFFYWFTYLMTWALPVAGLYVAIRDKDRPLIDVSLVMALVTLVTNKAYLGWPRHEWDPILLGIFLMAVAIGLRRWLSQGPHGQRHGFTPKRVLSQDSQVLTALSTASVTFQPHAPSSRPDPASGFDGGRSGGGGASGSY